jgi:uncharacterized protein YodC (DUF2158 family)
MTNSKSTYQIGDVVQLKSGGPLMTVHAIGDYSSSAQLNPGYLCIWFDGAKRVEEVFNPDTLEIYNH